MTSSFVQALSCAGTSACCFIAGALLGIAHFRSLQWNVRCLLGGHALLPLMIQVLRFTATGAALTLVVRGLGALPLLVGTLGMLAARTVLLLEPR